VSEASPFAVRDRVVVVTGGAGQLGRAFTAALKEAGARVAVIDRVAVAEVDSVFSVACDVTDRAALEDALSSIEKRWVRMRVSHAGLRTIDKKGIEVVLAELRSQGVKV
jgi:NAD(P)-dependent dehydrogenase (short-subunit alcohol dehydrogenase family)